MIDSVWSMSVFQTSINLIPQLKDFPFYYVDFNLMNLIQPVLLLLWNFHTFLKVLILLLMHLRQWLISSQLLLYWTLKLSDWLQRFWGGLINICPLCLILWYLWLLTVTHQSYWHVSRWLYWFLFHEPVLQRYIIRVLLLVSGLFVISINICTLFVWLNLYTIFLCLPITFFPIHTEQKLTIFLNALTFFYSLEWFFRILSFEGWRTFCTNKIFLFIGRILKFIFAQSQASFLRWFWTSFGILLIS